MIVSLNYTYKKYRARFLLYILSVGLIAAYVAMNISIPHYATLLSTTFSLFAAAIVSLCFAIRQSVVVCLVRKIKKGLGTESYGQADGGYWIAAKRISFYYQLEDGRIGRTEQEIGNRLVRKLKKLKLTTIPILVYKTHAILDEAKIKNNQINDEKNIEISENLIQTSGKTEYGRLIEGITLFVLGFLLILGSIITFILYGTHIISITLLMPLLFLTLINPITPIFIFFGCYCIRNHYFIPHIKDINRREKEELEKQGKKQKPLYGLIVPLRNLKVKNSKYCFGNKIKFIYKGSDGNNYVTIQKLPGKVARIINKSNSETVKILFWAEKQKAIVDENTILDKQETDLEHVVNFVKDYDIPFYAVLAVNLYFFVSEFIDLVVSKFTSGLSIFTCVMYLMTLIYMVVMFVLEKFSDNEIHAYWVTILFLLANMAVLPGIYIFSSLGENMSFVVKVKNFVGGGSIMYLSIVLYTSFLFVRFFYAIFNSHKTKALGLEYDRCQTFGDIVSNFYTLIVFLFNLLLYAIFSQVEGIIELTYAESKALHVFFVILIILMSILSFGLLVLCAKGMIENKNKKKTA